MCSWDNLNCLKTHTQDWIKFIGILLYTRDQYIISKIKKKYCNRGDIILMCNYILTTDLTANPCKLVAIIFILNWMELNENFFHVRNSQSFARPLLVLCVFFFVLSKAVSFYSMLSTWTLRTPTDLRQILQINLSHNGEKAFIARKALNSLQWRQTWVDKFHRIQLSRT